MSRGLQVGHPLEELAKTEHPAQMGWKHSPQARVAEMSGWR
ncbi:hypothetical protein [Cystobacter fuscus]|nr:hypothetical protein [Cystobacter fuscus]